MNDLFFKKELNEKVNRQYVSSRILLDKLCLVDEDSRKSGQYQDPLYLPFYFHLNKFIKPKNIAQIGLNLGLETCCFLQGNDSVERVFGFQKNNDAFYSERLALSNIKSISKKIKIDYYYGQIYDDEFIKKISSCYLIMINEKTNFDEIKNVIDISWQNLNLDGHLLMDYLHYDKKIEKIFLDFCKVQNRPSNIFNTRYGIGIICK
jgi:hypothetical protein